MPIDIDRALGALLEGPDYSWSEDEVILYHLGVGAGFDPVDPKELRYVYEGDLVVLPSFGSIPPFATMMGVLMLDGLDVNLAQILHGEQETVIHTAIPTSATVTNHGSVAQIYDKGKGALLVVEIITADARSGEPLFTNRSSLYIRGEGGFGGEAGPSAPSELPDRDPDHVVDSPTLAQQALLYRLSGDKNPLHADPGFAAFAGYERPILHGLGSYGIVAKAAIDSALDGDTSRVVSYRGRFSGVVFPGETLVTSVWHEGETLFLTAETKERGTPVITHGRMGIE